MNTAVNTANPFVFGAKVTLVRYPRFSTGEPSYSTHTISKVWKNGVFFLEGDYNSVRWSGGCNRDGEWSASASGSSYYSAGTLYMADNATVNGQREAARTRREAANKLAALANRIEAHRRRPLSPEQLAAVEAALAVFPEQQA